MDAKPPPLLTATLPGIGGRIKVLPEDFEVEEIPAYEPCGSGEHIYLWVEKRDLGAEYFLRQLARRLALLPGEAGAAGMKDRRAVTRQWVSVPASCESRVGDISDDALRVLKISRHTNKLRTGHLRGNRFRILIRDVAADAMQLVAPICDRIRQEGLPNFFGPQRFGQGGETGRLGMQLLGGVKTPRLSSFLRKLALSAAQSLLFNEYLTRRLTDGLLRTVLPGDVLAKWPAGGMFRSNDPATDQRRLEAREIIVAGPMYGRKTFPSAGISAEREAAILADAGLTLESFHNFGKLLEGTRRHNFVYVDELAAEQTPEGLRLTFTLPAGSYATVLLREVMKNDLVEED